MERDPLVEDYLHAASYAGWVDRDRLAKSLDGGVTWMFLWVGWCVDLSSVPF